MNIRSERYDLRCGGFPEEIHFHCAQHLLHFFEVDLQGLDMSLVTLMFHLHLEILEGPDLHAII